MSIKFCPYCGKTLAKETKFCPHCGKELNFRKREDTGVGTETPNYNMTYQGNDLGKRRPKVEGTKSIILGILFLIVGTLMTIIAAVERGSGAYKESVAANMIWGGSSSYAGNVDSFVYFGFLIILIGAMILLFGIAKRLFSKNKM